MTPDSLEEHKIYNAQIETIYQTIPTHLMTSVLVSILVAWVVWSDENSLSLMVWLSVNTVSVLLRFLSLRSFNVRKNENTGSLRKWAWLALVQVMINGFVWGMIPALFVDLGTDETAKVIVTYFFPVFIMIGQAVSYSAYKPMWFAYALPACGSMIAISLIDQAPGSDLWALYLFLLALFCIFSLQKNSKSFNETLKLKLEFADLMQRLQQEKENADQANQSKSTFLAAASHDLRQPVHAMNLFIELLQKKQLPGDASLLVDRIATSATSLQGLFNSLLDISSLDAGIIEINKKAINVAVFIQDLVALHTPEITGKGLQISIDTDEVTVMTDPLLLARILSNLLSNAVNYTSQGEIEVGAKVYGESVLVSVKDTGRGIAAENIHYIFDEFQQLHNPERDRNKGLGLGLAICTRLAALLDTKIEASSALDEGSTFSLSLPRGETVAEPVIDKIELLDDFFLTDYSIMIVDDEKDIRDAMPMLIESWGCHNVVAVSDQADAVAAINGGFIPDLIISDYRLRAYQSGIDVINKVSDLIGYKVRAILITGDTAPESLITIRESGFEFLHKPIISESLKQAVKNSLL